MYTCARAPIVVILGNELSQGDTSKVELNLKILLRYGGAKRVFHG